MAFMTHRDPSKRDIEHSIDELRGSPDPDRTESWRRFISEDLDPENPLHALWIVVGTDRSPSEGREWIRWHNGLDDETRALVERASIGGAGVPAGIEREKIAAIAAVAEAESNANTEADQ